MTPPTPKSEAPINVSVDTELHIAMPDGCVTAATAGHLLGFMQRDFDRTLELERVQRIANGHNSDPWIADFLKLIAQLHKEAMETSRAEAYANVLAILRDKIDEKDLANRRN